MRGILPLFRRRRFQAGFLTGLICSAALLSGCTDGAPLEGDAARLRISLGTAESFEVRSALPDEELVSDVNLFLFDGKGRLEEHIYADRLRSGPDGRIAIDAEWLCGTGCRIMACANFGYRMDVGSLDELLKYRYHLAYPDEYSRGIPMTGIMPTVIPILMKRCMNRQLARQ